ncbi:hypothetical protein Leryth_026582 [Lithospermum erythrorhizon]|nr:hypothetical protein Leryth_026582 [Lithospermum erythrorhizon]
MIGISSADVEQPSVTEGVCINMVCSCYVEDDCFSIIVQSEHFAGVAGGAASGKTAVCDMIIEQLHDQRVVLVNQVADFILSGIFDAVARRIRRDTVEKGRDISTVLDQYSKFVKPAFDDFIQPTKKYADVIIPRGGENHRCFPGCGAWPGHLHLLKKKHVTTPTGAVYTGVDFCKRLCGVSVLIYEKLPQDISDRHVLLLDPILGTGNSGCSKQFSLLLKKGVPESNIIFLNLISAPQGVHVVCKRFPRIKIVTSEIELWIR